MEDEHYPGLKEGRFLLVIMTKFQASMFQKLCNCDRKRK